MNPLSGIGGNNTPVRPLSDVPSVPRASDPASSDPKPADFSIRDTLDLSGSGQLLNRFSQLQSLGPERFEQAVASVVDLLQNTSSELGDTREGRLVANLADSFRQLADSGDLTPLGPRQDTGTSIASQRYRQAQEIGERGSFGFLEAKLGDDVSATGQGVLGQILTRVIDAVFRAALPPGA